MESFWQAMSGVFVVDASVVCSWVLPDEDSTIASISFERLDRHEAMSPDILWHEVRNVLMMARRRKRIAFETVLEGMAVLRRLRINITVPADDGLILSLAERHNLTAYDAAYLALAIERQVSLATLDKRLMAAAKAEGVVVIA